MVHKPQSKETWNSYTIWGKTDFKTKATRGKEHFILVEVLNHEEDITIINIHVPNKRALKWSKSDRTERRNRQFNSNSWRLQHPTSNVDAVLERMDRTRQKISTERRPEQHCKPTRPNRHLQNNLLHNTVTSEHSGMKLEINNKRKSHIKKE